jgi:hypothetical protein
MPPGVARPSPKARVVPAVSHSFRPGRTRNTAARGAASTATSDVAGIATRNATLGRSLSAARGC